MPIQMLRSELSHYVKLMPCKFSKILMLLSIQMTQNTAVIAQNPNPPPPLPQGTNPFLPLHPNVPAQIAFLKHPFTKSKSNWTVQKQMIHPSSFFFARITPLKGYKHRVVVLTKSQAFTFPRAITKANTWTLGRSLAFKITEYGKKGKVIHQLLRVRFVGFQALKFVRHTLPEMPT